MKFNVHPEKIGTKFKVFDMTIGILSSKTFLLWLLGCWVVFYVTIAIWTKETFAQFAMSLAKNPLVQIPFVLFLVSGYLNVIRASRDRLKGGKIQFFMWLVLPVGIMVFFTGFFVSITTRQFEWLIVGQEHIVKPRWSTESYRVVSIQPGLKESFLDIDIDAGKGIFRYEPKVTLMDKFSREFKVGAFPPTKIDGTYYHILNFGLAPGVSLSEGDTIKDEGYVPLRILRPGSSDYFEIPPYPYRFLISIEPEKVIQKGNLKASEFNIKHPSFRVRIFEGEKIIAEGISKEGIHFDNVTLNFFEPTFWFQLEVVKDSAVPIVLSGMGLIAIGIPLSVLRFLLKASGRHKGFI